MQDRDNIRETSYQIAAGAVIAAIYAALTFLTAPISFGAIQFRVSEAFCILPVFSAAAVPGVTVGCFLANFLSGAAPMDVVFGSFATLLGAVGTRKLKNAGALAAVPPILSNALIIPFVLRYAYGVPELIPFMMLTVGLGEVVSVGFLGNLLRIALIRTGAESLFSGS
ncbi:MAG: QueT transporter family protein [Stomatobaculum sp.]|nr:QueT transporter family protein [Stomatobaculum sp.]